MTHGFRTVRLTLVAAAVQLYWGLSIYAFSGEFIAPSYDGLRPFFPLVSALCTICGVLLIAIQWRQLLTWIRGLIHAVAAVPLFWLATSLVVRDARVGAIGYGALGVGLLVAPWLRTEGRRWGRSADLHLLVLGGVELALSLLFFAAPDLLDGPSTRWLHQHHLLAATAAFIGGTSLLLTPLARLSGTLFRYVWPLLGSLLPGMLAYNYALGQVWTGLVWLIHVAALLVTYVPFFSAGSDPMRGQAPVPEPILRVSRVVHGWNWVLVATVIFTSYLGALGPTRLAATLFIAINCTSYVIGVGLLESVPLSRVLFGHLAVLSLSTGLLLVPQPDPFGLACVVLLAVTPTLAAQALGRRAAVGMLFIVVIGLSAGQWLVLEKRDLLAWLAQVLVSGGLLVLGAAVGIRGALQQGQLVAELDQARRRLSRQVEQLQLIERITGLARRTLDLDEILHSCVGEIGPSFSADRCIIWMIDESGECTAVAGWAAEGVEPVSLGLRVPVSTALMAHHAQRAVLVEDVAGDPRMNGGGEALRDFLLRSGVAAMLGSVMQVNGKLVGALTLHQCSSKGGWSTEETAALEAISHPLGVAMVQARTHRALLQSYEELQAVNEELQSQGEELLAQQEELISQNEELVALSDELRTQRKWTERVLTSAGEGILVVNAEGRVSLTNPAAERLLGYGRGEILDRQLPGVLQHTDADGGEISWQDSPVAKTLRSGTSRRVRGDQFRRRSGAFFPVEYTVAPIGERGAITGAVLVFNDITEQRAVERMKDEFISVVSHELRTPLTAIRGSLGLLSSGKLGTVPSGGQRMLEIALQNTDRLVRLVNEILDIERIESGRAAIQKQRCSAQELVEQAAELMRPVADRASVGLEVHGADTLLWADPDRLVQTLTNLLSNAIKFSTAGSTVWLTAEREEDQVLFHVTDQGRGIPPEKLEMIFERFEQVDASDSREKGGTGLGLAICRAIVNQHGGAIWAESRLGEGSRFSVRLPADSGGEVHGD